MVIKRDELPSVVEVWDIRFHTGRLIVLPTHQSLHWGFDPTARKQEWKWEECSLLVLSVFRMLVLWCPLICCFVSGWSCPCSWADVLISREFMASLSTVSQPSVWSYSDLLAFPIPGLPPGIPNCIYITSACLLKDISLPRQIQIHPGPKDHVYEEFSSSPGSAVVALGRPYRLEGPQPFQFQGPISWRQFSHGPGMGGWFGRRFKCITFIVHFISNYASDLTGGTRPVAQKLGIPAIDPWIPNLAAH